jgi:hypothetical protein
MLEPKSGDGGNRTHGGFLPKTDSGVFPLKRAHVAVDLVRLAAVYAELGIALPPEFFSPSAPSRPVAVEQHGLAGR